MKTSVVLAAILGYALALPSIDWTNIRSKNAFVEPLDQTPQPVVPRIVGGTEVEPNSKPWVVALIIDGAHFCGGSLITRSFILSAGHCLEGYAYVQAILGAHNIGEAEPTQIVLTSTSIIVHPNYNPVNLNYDVALVRLLSPIVLNSNIQLATLAPATSGSFVDAEANLAGWGRLSEESSVIASTLHEVNVSVMANFWCSRTYGTEIVIASTLCTSGFGNIGGCDGDSGGPLISDGIQIGVASFVAGTGCQRGLPTGYARITSFRSWIISNTDLED